jgi:hypothetical protein
VSDDAPLGVLFVGPDGEEFLVPDAWMDSVVELVSPDDVRAAGLALHAVADAMVEAGPAASREAVERRAVVRVRERLVIWNVTSAETLYPLSARGRSATASGPACCSAEGSAEGSVSRSCGSGAASGARASSTTTS